MSFPNCNGVYALSVQCRCCAAHRLVKLDPSVAARTLGGSKGVYAIAAYPETVGAAVMEVEDGLHMAALCTYAADVPPFEDDQLLDFMAQVRLVHVQPAHGKGRSATAAAGPDVCRPVMHLPPRCCDV